MRKLWPSEFKAVQNQEKSVCPLFVLLQTPNQTCHLPISLVESPCFQSSRVNSLDSSLTFPSLELSTLCEESKLCCLWSEMSLPSVPSLCHFITFWQLLPCYVDLNSSNHFPTGQPSTSFSLIPIQICHQSACLTYVSGHGPSCFRTYSRFIPQVKSHLAQAVKHSPQLYVSLHL